MAIPLLLAPIVSMLANKGLDLLSGAIEGGADKAIDFIEEKTGIKVEPEMELTPEQEAALKKLEAEESIALQQLALESKKEDNRHKEAVADDAAEKYSVAHNSYDKHSEATDKLSFQIMRENLIIIGILIIVECLALMYLREQSEMIAVISGLIGAVVNSLLSERQAVVNFRFGSSIGSKLKNAMIGK